MPGGKGADRGPQHRHCSKLTITSNFFWLSFRTGKTHAGIFNSSVLELLFTAIFKNRTALMSHTSLLRARQSSARAANNPLRGTGYLRHLLCLTRRLPKSRSARQASFRPETNWRSRSQPGAARPFPFQSSRFLSSNKSFHGKGKGKGKGKGSGSTSF